jgi:hypothetical protein
VVPSLRVSEPVKRSATWFATTTAMFEVRARSRRSWPSFTSSADLCVLAKVIDRR